MDTRQLADADRRVLWHPFTQQQGWTDDEEVLLIERANRCTLFDTDGNPYLDGVSSLWCNVHGHRHPAIDAAIRRQLAQVAHTTMLGLSHPPAVELAVRLTELAPPGLSRVFFSDNGSTACEVALKMAYQWWAQRGERARTRFVCLEMSYHGDTLGSVSVGGIPLFHELYQPLLFDAVAVPAGDVEAMAAALDDTVAAVIMEPLVQGAAGMLLHPPGYLSAVRSLTRERGIPLIVDEVATGFGRTGTMFACEQEDVAPDLLCLAKGLTGGYLPLAATLTTEAVYEGFLGAFEEFRTFFHGHTYTGNPLACAAAHATLDVFDSERTLERLQPKIALLADALDERIAPLAAVREIRRCGLMTGIELVGFPLDARVGHRVAMAARARGVIIRPLGDVVVLMPPLAITEAEVRRLVAVTAEAIVEVATPAAACAVPAPVGAGDPRSRVAA
jgi:adenosylmethionine---8-amino-7-oxononanoate aminotransferase